MAAVIRQLEKEMTYMTEYERIKTQLTDRLDENYNAFIDSLKKKSPDEILDAAYEKVFKEDIAYIMEPWDGITIPQMKTLLKMEDPLDALYRQWMETDETYIDTLINCMEQYLRGLES